LKEAGRDLEAVIIDRGGRRRSVLAVWKKTAEDEDLLPRTRVRFEDAWSWRLTAWTS
jgi:hypothetical protein